MKRFGAIIALMTVSSFSEELYKNAFLGGIHCAFARYRPIPYLSLSYERIGKKIDNNFTINYGHLYYDHSTSTEEFSGNLGAYYTFQYRFANRMSIGPLLGFIYSTHYRNIPASYGYGGYENYTQIEIFDNTSLAGIVACFVGSRDKARFKIENKLLFGYNLDAYSNSFVVRYDLGIDIGSNFGKRKKP